MVQNSVSASLPRRRQRFVVLFFACLFTFGSYFCFDTPGALGSELEHGSLKLSATEFNLLYSVYAWPNILLVFLGGFFIDTLGSRPCSVVLSLITLIGQLITTIGIFFKSFKLLLLGRFLFGCGSESLNVCQSTIVSHWFQGSELAMAFGFSLTVSRLGSIIAFNILPSYSQRFGLSAAFLLGALLCIVSFVATLCFVYVDKKAEEEFVFSQQVVEASLTDVEHKFPSKGIFPLSFWLGSITGMVAYSIFFSFIAIGTDLFQLEFDMPGPTCGFLVSLIYNVSMFLAPLLGKLLDLYGYRGVAIGLAMLFTSFSLHVLSNSFHYTKLFPIFSNMQLLFICSILLGLGLSGISSALWPTLAICVSPQSLATAIGIAQALQNLGTSLTTFFMGIIIDRKGYRQALQFLQMLGMFSCFVVLCWNLVDKFGDDRINRPSEQLEEIEELQQPLASEKQTSGKLMIVPVTPRVVILVRQRLLGPQGESGIVRRNYYAKIGIQ
jgi:MFS family permease